MFARQKLGGSLTTVAKTLLSASAKQCKLSRVDQNEVDSGTCSIYYTKKACDSLSTH
jgi:hypothetical protein